MEGEEAEEAGVDPEEREARRHAALAAEAMLDNVFAMDAARDASMARTRAAQCTPVTDMQDGRPVAAASTASYAAPDAPSDMDEDDYDDDVDDMHLLVVMAGAELLLAGQGSGAWFHRRRVPRVTGGPFHSTASLPHLPLHRLRHPHRLLWLCPHHLGCPRLLQHALRLRPQPQHRLLPRPQPQPQRTFRAHCADHSHDAPSRVAVQDHLRSSATLFPQRSGTDDSSAEWLAELLEKACLWEDPSRTRLHFRKVLHCTCLLDLLCSRFFHAALFKKERRLGHGVRLRTRF